MSFDNWFNNYPIAYMDDDSHIHWLGNYVVDDEGKYLEKAIDDAGVIARTKGHEITRMIEGDDFTDLSSEIQTCFNKGNMARGNDYVMIGTFIDRDEVELLDKLCKEHPKSEFLLGLKDECKRAFKHKKEKAHGI